MAKMRVKVQVSGHFWTTVSVDSGEFMQAAQRAEGYVKERLDTLRNSVEQIGGDGGAGDTLKFNVIQSQRVEKD